LPVSPIGDLAWSEKAQAEKLARLSGWKPKILGFAESHKEGSQKNEKTRHYLRS
jgi:hypothetical protein